jgi:hypothetical protein
VNSVIQVAYGSADVLEPKDIDRPERDAVPAGRRGLR